jgi:hypothetical protein
MDTDTGIAATPATADAAGERPPVGCVVIEGVEVPVERENVAAETTGEGEGEGEGKNAPHVATDRDNCDAVIVVGQKADRLDAAYKMFRGSTTRRGRGRAAAAPTARTEAEEDAYDEFSELDSENKDQGERSADKDEDDGSRDEDEDDGSHDEDDGSHDEDEDDGSHDESHDDDDEDEEENEEESVAPPVVAAAANRTQRPPVRVPSKVVAVAVKRPERLTLRTVAVAASADTNTTRRGPRVSSKEAVVAPVNKQPRRRSRPPPAPASPAPRREKQHPGRHAEKVKDRGAQQEDEENFFKYPAARSRVDVIVQEEVKIRRLRQLRDIFDSSPYFDLQDISSISAEIFESEQEIKHLLAPLSDAEKEVLGMQVTIKQRELMIEKAVANNLLVPQTDNVFQTLVTKQVRLLKLVTRFSTQ